MCKADQGLERDALVVGAGRIGTFVACQLAKSGWRVTLKSSGRAVMSNLDRQSAAMCEDVGVARIGNLAGITGKRFGLLVLTTKTYAWGRVVEELEASKVSASLNVLVHNGMKTSPFANSARVVTTQSYDFVDTPGKGCGVEMHIKNAEHPWVLPPSAEGKRAEAILNEAGVYAKADPNFAALSVRKYLINGVANLMAIVGDCNCNGLMRDHRPRMTKIFHELVSALSVAHAEGFAALPKGPELEKLVFDGLASFGEHFPSTKLDFDAGNRLEVESLNGYAVELANARGTPARENEALLKDVAELTRKRDAQRDVGGGGGEEEKGGAKAKAGGGFAAAGFLLITAAAAVLRCCRAQPPPPPPPPTPPRTPFEFLRKKP